MNVRSTTVLALATLSTACATMPPAHERVAEARRGLDQAPLCCVTLADAKRLTLPREKTRVVLDASMQAWTFEGRRAYFVLYELPAFTQAYALSIRSFPEGTARDATLLVPRVTLYDGAFRATRSFDETTLRARGATLERTVFVNPKDAGERYVAIFGADVTRVRDLPYSTVNQTMLPVGPAAFLTVYHGTDESQRIVSAPIGALEIEVVPQ